METEKIVSTVQEKVGNTDLSSKTIQTIVENFPVTGDEPDDAYFEKVTGIVKSLQGQFNHDFSTKFAEAKKNFKLDADTIKTMSQEQLAEIKTLLTSEGHEDHSSDKELEALKQTVQQLTERANNAEKAKAQEEILRNVKAAMKAKGAEDEYVLNNTLKGVVFATDKSVDELTEEYLKKYDTEYKECRGEGATPRVSSSGDRSGKHSVADAFFARKAKKEGWGK